MPIILIWYKLLKSYVTYLTVTINKVLIRMLNHLLLFIILSTSAISFASSNSDTFLPFNILKLDQFYTHHVLVAEKSSHKLYVFENKNGSPKLLKVFQMATGKKAGDKLFLGDHRTPEGIYQIVGFLPHESLIQKYGETGKIYGVGAFVLNYPNPVDQSKHKTGGGIWIHSTNDETRIEKGLDSRGCIVTANKDLIEISKLIELNKTYIVVVHDLNFQNDNTWLNNQGQISNLLDNWLKAWQTENFEQYISHYHKNEFNDSFRGSYTPFKSYKKAVFSNPGAPEISISHISFLKVRDYAIITFTQNYKSSTIEDIGKKTLYLKKDEFYNWKIVKEIWRKVSFDEKDPIAFKPSMRFFSKDFERTPKGSVTQ